MLKDAHLLALGDLRLPTSHRALTRLNLVAARSQKGLCGPVSLVCGRGMKIRIPYSNQYVPLTTMGARAWEDYAFNSGAC